MKLESLLQYIDAYLSVGDHPDYSTALNGLQVDGADEIHTIVTAVDASAETIRAASEVDADLMIVHHGIFWGGLRPLTGPLYRRVRMLLDGDIALYSCHLPLDAHAEIGNSALLARAVGVEPTERFGSYKGASIGWWGSLDSPLGVDALRDRVAAAVGGAVTVLPGGPDSITRVGVVTGGGGSFIPEAADLGLDAFVTGEGSHHHAFDAAELGIHVLLGGHYATETFGVRALGEHLAERFGLEVRFVDRPTGL